MKLKRRLIRQKSRNWSSRKIPPWEIFQEISMIYFNTKAGRNKRLAMERRKETEGFVLSCK